MNTTPTSFKPRDWILAATLFAVAAGVAHALAGWWGPFVRWAEFDNIYFQADSSLVYANLTDPASNHYRTGMHPLYSVVLLPSVALIERLTGLDGAASVRLLLDANLGLQVAVAYLVSRRITASALDAALCAGLLLVSSASLFWGTVPDTFSMGATTMLVMLLIMTNPRPVGTGALIAGNLATASMTLTNWMVGIWGTLALLRGQWRRALTVFGSTAALLVAFGALSKLLFPSSGVVGSFARYLQYFRWPEASDFHQFFIHGVVMPGSEFRLRFDGVHEVVLTQDALGAVTPFAPLASVLWLALLGLGAVGIVGFSKDRRLAATLGLTLACQFLLHIGFSVGPFLFTAHFVPLLILVAAHAFRIGSLRRVARALAAGVVVLAGYNNLHAFAELERGMQSKVRPWLERNGTLMEDTNPRPKRLSMVF